MGNQECLNPEMICKVALKFGVANFIGEPSSTLIRRDVFRRFGGFNKTMIQLCDIEFWLRIGVSCGIAYVPDALVHFRIHGRSTTSGNTHSRRFQKDVIDPLLLFAEFASGSHYLPLRNVAATLGKDLRNEFTEKLISAQRWGADAQSPEWAAAIESFPQLRMPANHRIRKLIGDAVNSMRGAL